MELNTHNAEILLSAANKSHYPQDELPEIALAGRSNVGKSSFINMILISNTAMDQLLFYSLWGYWRWIN